MFLVLVVLSVVLGLGVSGSPLSAATPPVEPPVGFDIVGFRCEVDVIRDVVRRDGSRLIQLTQSGETEASIALMTGTLTVQTTAVIRPDGTGRTHGRWVMQPAASTGSLRGSLRGSITDPVQTEIVSIGHGINALRGVSVRMTTTTPASTDGAPCESDLAFEGSGTASYRNYPDPTGAVVIESTKSFEDTVADLTATIEAPGGLNLVRTVDHQAAAAGRDLVLPPTTELFFGNPAVGTPLMQDSQTTAIDLPQKMLITEDLFGVVRVSYNASTYLQARHSIDGADQQLIAVTNALAGLAATATGTPAQPVFEPTPIRDGAGLVEITSERSVDDAFAAIVDALDAAPPINVVFTLDHSANAASIGQDLRPTKLVVFGNPSLGSILMGTDQSIALDLPQKILVYENEDGQTVIAYNNPYYVAQRHDVRAQGKVLQLLNGALANFASKGQ